MGGHSMADFSLAMRVLETRESRLKYTAAWAAGDLESPRGRMVIGGSPAYISPEVLAWALGCPSQEPWLAAPVMAAAAGDPGRPYTVNTVQMHLGSTQVLNPNHVKEI